MIKASFFERILTTNVDTLLEQALDLAGLQLGYDYQVTSLGVAVSGTDSEGIYEASPELSQTAQPKQIIKLFGDLAQEQVNINPWETDKALKSQRRYIKSELEGGIVMVGYNFESKPINEWLNKGGSRRNQLWWVSEELPVIPSGTLPISSWASQVSLITGAIAEPQEFFGQLRLRLLRRPSFELPSYAESESKQERRRKGYIEVQKVGTEEMREENFSLGADLEKVELAEDVGKTSAEVKEGDEETDTLSTQAEVTASPDELSLIEELRSNIRRSQAVLVSLERTAVPGNVPASVRAQAVYQKKQIAKMEEKVRTQASSRQAILQTLNALAQNVSTTNRLSLDNSTIEFLKSQVQIVKDEYGRDEPNHYILSTAIGAITVLVERLYVEFYPKEEVVKPENMRRLATYAPSLAGRRLI